MLFMGRDSRSCGRIAAARRIFLQQLPWQPVHFSSQLGRRQQIQIESNFVIFPILYLSRFCSQFRKSTQGHFQDVEVGRKHFWNFEVPWKHDLKYDKLMISHKGAIKSQEILEWPRKASDLDCLDHILCSCCIDEVDDGLC